MKKRLFFLLNFMLVMSLVVVSPASARDNQQVLQPGEVITFEQKVPINIVFIGYDQNTINTQEVLDVLPATYAPIVRVAPFYGLPGRNIGLQHNFDYRITFAGKDLTNRFFRYLRQIGTKGDPTAYQLMYNDQESNVLDVTGPVLYIDAP